MAAKRDLKIELPSLDDIFTTQEQRDDARLKRIYEIPISQIDDFPDHPFKVIEDEDMMNIVESIRENGMITPAVVRKKEDGRYELLFGHREINLRQRWEKAESRSEGYLLNEKTYTVNITEEGDKETINTYNQFKVPQQVKRGNLEFIKVSGGDLNRMAGISFDITSVTTGESHRVVTDENGYVNTASSWISHLQNTNRGETSQDGIWFGETRSEDSKGALIYDTYIVEEVRCPGNEGMDLLKFKVNVYRDSVIVQLGTLTNDRVKVNTSAEDAKTRDNFGIAEETVMIRDTVSYEHLKKGEEYKVTGTLMDKSTGNPVMIDGKPFTSEKTFTAEDTAGKVIVEFEVPGELVYGKTVVVFEELYQNDILLGFHADINDEDQTISYPAIRTSAEDTVSGTRYGNAAAKTVIKDTVSFEGVKPGIEYTVRGILIDKETGLPVTDNGKEITAYTDFRPLESYVKAEVTFTVPENVLKGKAVAVFERLMLGDTVIALHEDINDEAQLLIVENPEEPEKPEVPEEPEKPEIPEKPDKLETPSSPISQGTPSYGYGIPKTGDDSDIGIFVALLLIAGAAVTAIRVIERKKHK